MKTYVLLISEAFPKGHPRHGAETNFVEKILDGDKLHTIRANYDLWEKRFREIAKGKAIISIRTWSGIPYRSLQNIVIELDKYDDIGLQKLNFQQMIITTQSVIKQKGKDGTTIWIPDISDINNLSRNDGLTINDFQDWFSSYDLSKPMAIIHFTKFRYI